MQSGRNPGGPEVRNRDNPGQNAGIPSIAHDSLRAQSPQRQIHISQYISESVSRKTQQRTGEEHRMVNINRKKSKFGGGYFSLIAVVAVYRSAVTTLLVAVNKRNHEAENETEVEAVSQARRVRCFNIVLIKPARETVKAFTSNDRVGTFPLNRAQQRIRAHQSRSQIHRPRHPGIISSYQKWITGNEREGQSARRRGLELQAPRQIGVETRVNRAAGNGREERIHYEYGCTVLEPNSSRAVKKTKTDPFQNSEVRLQSRAQNRNPEAELELCSIHEDGQPRTLKADYREADRIKTKKRYEMKSSVH
ncbi:hypothetical protein B0H13DRAFT_1915678 [Mycena leptocephala]|nr:hypothetical protein B0H13DRAFT_1915678 [Mycena leptocephala]